MMIREIAEDDLDAVCGLLVEGFPQRSYGYWAKGLTNLSSLAPVEGFPKYGYLVDADYTIQGVLLTITSDHGVHGAWTNFSSWYVRKEYRHFATILFTQALKLRNTTFLNPSPSKRIIPILKAFGFEPYTIGTVALDLRRAIRKPPPRGEVRRLGVDELARLSEREGRTAEDHMRMGCDVLYLQTDDREGLLIHRRKWIKRSLPCSQVIFTEPDLMGQLVAPVMRALGSRGSLLALCDIDEAPDPSIGHVFARGIRYFKGVDAPSVGDLTYSELAVFGP
jgi:hypothetical protein